MAGAAQQPRLPHTAHWLEGAKPSCHVKAWDNQNSQIQYHRVSQSFHTCCTEMKGTELCQELPSPRTTGSRQELQPTSLLQAGPHTHPQLGGLQKNKSEPWLDFISFAYTKTVNLLFASKCIQRSQETEGDSLVATTSSLTALGAKYPFKPCLLSKSSPFKRMYNSALLK